MEERNVFAYYVWLQNWADTMTMSEVVGWTMQTYSIGISTSSCLSHKLHLMLPAEPWFHSIQPEEHSCKTDLSSSEINQDYYNISHDIRYLNAPSKILKQHRAKVSTSD